MKRNIKTEPVISEASGNLFMKRLSTFFNINAVVLRAVCLTATVAVSLGFGADDWRFGVEVRPVVVQSFRDFLPQVSQIPASLRQVPIHPDDTGAGTLVLIPGSKVMPGSYVPLSSVIAPELSYGRLTLRAGGVFSWAAAAPTAKEGSTGSTQEQNYQGSGRTIGAALVYYAVLARPSYVPGVLGELEVRTGHGLSLLVGYQRSRENAVLQQGWDRYDSLQTYQGLVLSQDVVQHEYAGVRWSQSIGRSWRTGAFVFAGPAQVSQNPTSLGKGAVFSYNKNPFFIATGVDFQWDWHRRKSAVNGR